MLRAGAASVVITPPLGLTVQAATHQKRARWVRDELEANALYVAGDGDGIVLVSGDLAGMEPEQVARICGRAGAAAGISPRSIILAFTHTHGGPVMMPSNRYNAPDPAYHAQLEDRLVEVVARAVAAARPAELAWGQGQAVLGYNRRLCFADGSHAMHGNTRRPDFTGLEGASDPHHTALFARGTDGAPIAVVYNNASHPTTFYGADCFSADFPGAARKLIREALGGPVPVLYLNGAQGDISLEDMLAPAPYGEKPDLKVMRGGAIAAGETLRLLYEAEFTGEAVVRHAVTDVRVAVRLPAPERLAWAKEMLGEADRHRETKSFETLFAHGAMLLQERFGADPVDVLPVHAIRIGGLGVATLPGEFYCQFGIDIRRRSPAPVTAVVGIADGSHGYCPTMSAIIGGGYSGEAIFWTRLAPDAGYRVVDEACRLLRTLWG